MLIRRDADHLKYWRRVGVFILPRSPPLFASICDFLSHRESDMSRLNILLIAWALASVCSSEPVRALSEGPSHNLNVDVTRIQFGATVLPPVAFARHCVR